MGAVACALLVLSACTPRAGQQPVRFVIASDLHAQDIPFGERNIRAVAGAATAEGADFLIQLGDFVRMDSAGRALEALWNAGYAGPKYHVLGNHDLDPCTKEQFVEGFGMPGRYYSFDRGDFHFVVLDGNNLFDGRDYKPYDRGNYYSDPSQRPFIDEEQLAWLAEDLRATDKRCVLFSHQSIDTSMKNGAAVREVLEAENGRAGFRKVVLAFSGHTHSNYTKRINGIVYVQINSASYVWIGAPTATERRYPTQINDRYHLLASSMPYTEPLYAVVSLDAQGATVKGTKADFVPPTPADLQMPDSIGGFPLVSSIEDVRIEF